jgi:hypothetical protein
MQAIIQWASNVAHELFVLCIILAVVGAAALVGWLVLKRKRPAIAAEVATEAEAAGAEVRGLVDLFRGKS